MEATMCRHFAIPFLILMFTGTIRAEDVDLTNAPPVVVKTIPESGQDNVDPATTEIKVTYSKDMQDHSWSWSTAGTDNFPEMTGKPHYEKDNRTCVITVHLKPGKSYAIWLNSENFGTFKDTGGRSAVPYLLVFKTSGKAEALPATQASDSEFTPDGFVKISQSLSTRMKLADQPQGCSNRWIRISADDRFQAFYSVKNSISSIVVVDLKTGAKTTVPPPDEKIFEARNIRQFTWSRAGQTLYIAEDATTGPTSLAAWKSLPPESVVTELKKIYQVLYFWSPGDAKVHLIGRVNSSALAIAARDDDVRVVTRSVDKGWGHVDIWDFKGNLPGSLRTIPVALNGKPIDLDWPQLMLDHNELWFVSVHEGGGSALAMIDLNQAGPEAQLIAEDVLHFVWSMDEQRLIVRKVSGHSSSLWLMHRDSLKQSPVLLNDHFGNEITGVSNDGYILYFQGVAPEDVGKRIALSSVGDAIRLFSYDLPQ
jgi:Bacterial Ig-like domain